MPRKRKAARAYTAPSDIQKAIQQAFRNRWAFVDTTATLRRVAAETGTTEADAARVFRTEFPNSKGERWTKKN